MSAHMKKHPTKKDSSRLIYVVDNEKVYAIPKIIAEKYTLDTLEAKAKPDNISAEYFFSDLDNQTTKAATLLRGLRSRENLSQIEFAKRLGITQSNLSKMENGARTIGKSMAKRIATEFDIDYKYFL